MLNSARAIDIFVDLPTGARPYSANAFAIDPTNTKTISWRRLVVFRGRIGTSKIC